MGKLISNEPSRTFSEFLFIPNKKEEIHRPENVSLVTPLVKYRRGEEPSLKLNIPFTSAIMQAVSVPDLAIALAEGSGGLATVYQSQPIEEQAAMVRKVKRHKAHFVVSDSNLRPKSTLEDALTLKKKTGHSTIAITEDGSARGILVGVLTSRDIKSNVCRGEEVRHFMTPLNGLAHGLLDIGLEEAYDIMCDRKQDTLPIIDKERHLHYFVFRKDIEGHQANPNELVDKHGSLMIGAGINTWDDDYPKRVPALLDAGADVLCIDSANGFTCWQEKTIQWIRKEYGDAVKVGGGNVVDKEGFMFLFEAGFDFIKIGIGGGSICITRDQKGLGRGQMTALMEIADVRDKLFEEKKIYVPLCSDGAISLVYHISLALAYADFVMMGGYFARFDEAPGELKSVDGMQAKEYWGEATERAKNLSRYDYPHGAQRFAYEEGWDGYVPYAGELKKGVEADLPKIRDIICDSAALTIPEFHEKARLTLVSPATMGMSGATVMTKKFGL